MAKVKLICKACGKELEREEKPAPKTRGEARQIYYHCTCGAKTLRDGTCLFLRGGVVPLPQPEAPVAKPLVTPTVQPKPRKERKHHATQEKTEPEYTSPETRESESGFFF